MKEKLTVGQVIKKAGGVANVVRGQRLCCCSPPVPWVLPHKRTEHSGLVLASA